MPYTSLIFEIRLHPLKTSRILVDESRERIGLGSFPARLALPVWSLDHDDDKCICLNPSRNRTGRRSGRERARNRTGRRWKKKVSW
jgi:hypothetical protein